MLSDRRPDTRFHAFYWKYHLNIERNSWFCNIYMLWRLSDGWMQGVGGNWWTENNMWMILEKECKCFDTTSKLFWNWKLITDCNSRESHASIHHIILTFNKVNNNAIHSILQTKTPTLHVMLLSVSQAVIYFHNESTMNCHKFGSYSCKHYPHPSK